MKGTRNKKAGQPRAETPGKLTKKLNTGNGRLHLNVGKPWTEPLEVRVEEPGSARKDRVNVVLAVGFLVLLYLIAGYAMKTGDGSLVRDVLKITASGLIFAAVWAGGRAALKVLSGWRESR